MCIRNGLTSVSAHFLILYRSSGDPSRLPFIMAILKKVSVSYLVILAIVTGTFLLVRCTANNTRKETVNDKYPSFAGSASCAPCHKDLYEKHLRTEHFLSSEPSKEDNILGSFKPGNNTFTFNPMNKVVMEKRDSGLFQVAYINGQEKRTGRFDITVGSGRKGQSYLSWIRNSLIQMPITYFSPESTWANSPGFDPKKIVFNRVVTSRCLECHMTYAWKTSDTATRPETFDHNKFIYGVDCERCHGPAREHVEFHTQNPSIKEARYIVNTGKLSRQRNLDLCALCHGGQLNKTQPSFTYQAGDSLMDYFYRSGTPAMADNIDLHGNQLGLLQMSKCFMAGQMTCLSCHNVHENERDKVEVFSQRCLNCHQQGKEKDCKLLATAGPVIKQNCVDCHMPKQKSHAVAVFMEGAEIPTAALLRTHYIKVSPEETEKVMKLISGKHTTMSSVAVKIH